MKLSKISQAIKYIKGVWRRYIDYELDYPEVLTYGIIFDLLLLYGLYRAFIYTCIFLLWLSQNNII